jgi:hypothetical protein
MVRTIATIIAKFNWHSEMVIELMMSMSLSALHKIFQADLIFSGSEYHEESNWYVSIENKG